MGVVFFLLKVIALASLLAIFYQDQKERRVYLWLFIVVCITFGVLHLTKVGWYQFVISLLFNVGITVILLGVLAGYSKFRMPSVTFLQVFGLGDILFIVALSLGFSTLSFITLLVFGLLFSLVLHQVWLGMFSRLPAVKVGKRTKTQVKQDLTPTNGSIELDKTVPLAGYLALFFAGVLVVHWLGFYSNLYVS